MASTYLGAMFSLYLAGMKTTEEKACLCALNRIFGFEPKTAHALISHCGCASGVFALAQKELDELMGPYSRHRSLIRKAAVYEAADEIGHLLKTGTEFIGWGEDGYPPLLAECPDAPVGLYIRSRTPATELWTTENSLAIVGTRDISPYGKEWCSKTVEGLASTKEQPLIVSGLALGTDICAHKAAIENGLPTIAVMATGPDTVYPFRHWSFAEQLIRTPGCALVTDYPPGTPPLPIHFLRRNRIIAGLSQATVLIESKLKGGGMMTARLAFSYDREVYALPGRADDVRSQGCNKLISDKIAEPLISIDTLTLGMGFQKSGRNPVMSIESRLRETYSSRVAPSTLNQLTGIISLIRRTRGITVEDIACETGLGYSKVSALTAMLEVDGFIQIDLLQRCVITR